MKKLLFIILIALSFKALSAQRGGHFGGGHFGGEHFGGYRSNGYFSQPRITIHSAPIFKPSLPVAPRMAIREGYLPYAHRGINFYYRGGFFYDSYFNWFYPPIGFAIMTLPYGYYNFTYGGNPYYYYGGVYYIQNNNQYEVVSPVLGAIVPELPKDTKVIYIDGKKCYVTKDNVYYEEFIDDNVLKYKVIGKEDK